MFFFVNGQVDDSEDHFLKQNHIFFTAVVEGVFYKFQIKIFFTVMIFEHEQFNIFFLENIKLYQLTIQYNNKI